MGSESGTEAKRNAHTAGLGNRVVGVQGFQEKWRHLLRGLRLRCQGTDKWEAEEAESKIGFWAFLGAEEVTETLGAEELAQDGVEWEEQEPGREPAGHRKVSDSQGTKSGACLHGGGESLRPAHCGHMP